MSISTVRPLHLRVALLLLMVGVGVGASLSTSLNPEAGPNPESKRSLPAAGEPRLAVPVPNAAAIAKNLAACAKERWVSDGLDPALARALQDDAERVMHSVLTYDFPAYHQWMSARGGVPGKAFNAIVEGCRGAAAYRNDKHACWAGSDNVAKMARLWSANYYSQIVKMNIEPCIAGYGTIHQEANTSVSRKGTFALAMYDYPQMAKLVNGGQKLEIKIAWVGFIAEFALVPELTWPDQLEQLKARGTKGPVEIHFAFAYDEVSGKWFPVWTRIASDFSTPFIGL